MIEETTLPKARSSAHEAVLSWFASQKRGTVLDIPAGYGHLSMKLHEMGFLPTCAEIQPEILKVPGLKTIYSNLNRHIDAPDDSFDYVACIEGLEHMTDPYQAAKEIGRVLKPSGYAIFSLPNYTNIERRIRFLLTGSLLLPISDDKLKRFGNRLFEFHNSPLTITLIEFILRKEGLKLQEIRRDKTKRGQQFFMPLIWLVQKILRFLPHESRQKYRFDLTFHPEVVLGGNTIIIITKKRN